jgi:CRISPR system Cascade subunit CasE
VVIDMPYLSRIWLNPLRTGAQRMLRNPHVVHAAVLGGLSRQPVDERVLWRLEPDSPHRAGLLVLTHSRPSWEHLVEQAGWPNSDEPQALVRPYELLLDQVARGREFAFRLNANPVMATRNPANPSTVQKERLTSVVRPRGVRVPHRTAAHQLEWLTSRVARWGFEIPDDPDGVPGIRLTRRDRLIFSKGGDNDRGHRVVLQTALFDGRLRVADPDAARTSLLSGVGSGRAYGCGLITLAPVPPALTET